MKDLPEALKQFNLCKIVDSEPMPWLAALVCASPFDIAIHDAFGMVNNVPIYHAYGKEFLSSDLSQSDKLTEGLNSAATLGSNLERKVRGQRRRLLGWQALFPHVLEARETDRNLYSHRKYRTARV